MKIAIVHEWFVTYAGSERAVEQILAIFPDADLFSLIDFMPANERGFIMNKKVKTSFLQKMPFARKHYRNYLPLMPCAIERLDLSGYDLVITSSHAVAKSVKTKNIPNICYCYTPIRYAWDMSEEYLRSSGFIKRLIAGLILSYIRKWDKRTAERVDYFMAISEYIAARIKRIYGRESFVIYPPVDTDAFTISSAPKEDYYLTASRMVPYKRMDLIVETFAQMPDKKLVVIGEGPDMRMIRSKATKNIELLGHQPYEALKEHMQKARAFIFASEEDFGIAPVEAQACGTPVIAFKKGGATETVIENKTGLFFDKQTVESLKHAILEFEQIENKFDRSEIRKNAERFSIDNFKNNFKDHVEKCIASYNEEKGESS